MTPCARGCCWTAFQVCAKARACDCHWGDWLIIPKPTTGRSTPYRDPTGNEAVHNAMRAQRKE